MNNEKYTYRLQLIVTGILVWELLFWGMYFLLINAFGFFSSGNSSEKLIYRNPEALHALFGLVPIVGVYIYNTLQNNRLAAKSSPSVVRSFLHPVSSMNSFMKYFFLRNAFVLLIIALAQPVFGTKKVAGTTESLELVIALDISNSMNAMDISDKISRLGIAKRAMVQLINNLHGEKIGICLFANSAFVQLPITGDYGAAKLFIEDIETSMISSQGTNIRQALEVSSEMFSEQKTTKGIILITDGENHEENPDNILKKIRESNMQLSVLGIGTKRGGLVPNNPDKPNSGYKTNAVGKTVLSRLNEPFIRNIAQKGGGKATISANEFPDLSALLTEISQMKRTKIDNLEFDVKQERYQIPLILSIAFWFGFLLWSKQYVGFLDRMIKK